MPLGLTEQLRAAHRRRPLGRRAFAIASADVDIRFAIALAAGVLAYGVLAWIDVRASSSYLALAGSCAVAALAGLVIFARARTAIPAAILSVALSTGFALTGRLSQPPLLEILALTALLTVLTLRRRTILDIAEMGAVTAALVLLSIRVAAPLWLELVLTGASVLAVGAGSIAHHVIRREREAVERTRAQERTRLSRDLHDLVAHHVTGIVVVAREARMETDPRRVEQLLDAIETAGSDALRESRRLVSHLRTDVAAESDGEAEEHDLSALVRAFQLSGAAQEVSAHLPEQLADPEVAALVHRVVAEALANIQRHAYGTERVEISVTELGAEKVFVTVDDAGVEGTSAPFALGSGTGLRGLRERLDEVGGTLDSRATAKGWRVQAVIPARPAERPALLRRTS